jgi:DNA-binding transcriptional LysR family regulator
MGDQAFNNIPTELLRTLLALADLRSFTQTAKVLGVTQPAVSAQIKRLQALLGGELLDRRAPGVVLTPKGEKIVNFARRLISINDQIIGLTAVKPKIPTIQIGLPGDLSGPLLPWTLAKFRKRWPNYDFKIRSGTADPLLNELRQGDIDVVVALSHDEPKDARHSWPDQLIWARSDATAIDAEGPVPMLAFSEDCMCYRAGVKALNDIGRDTRLVLSASTVLSLSAGVDSGVGVLVMTRSRIRMTTLTRWDDGPLPVLPQLYVGIYVREGTDTEPLQELADDLAPLLRPKPDDGDMNRREYQAVSTAFGKAASLVK